MRKSSYRDFVLLSMFVAIIFILMFTPIGFINLPLIKATIVHVPVIIGAILLGPKKGAVLGAFFGLASLINNSMIPALLSFAFSPFIPAPGATHGSPLALVICFVPRILVGVVPVYLYRFLCRLGKGKKGVVTKSASLAIAGIFGAFTNTILVMGMIFLFFKDSYAALKGIPSDAVLGVVLGVVGANGVPEAIVAAVLTALVCQPLQKLMKANVPQQVSIAAEKPLA